MVLNHVASEVNLRRIAGLLFVSHNTVKSQVRSLYSKLGAKSREDAIVRARGHGLLAEAPDHQLEQLRSL